MPREAPETLCESLREIAESIVDVSTQEGKTLLRAADALERYEDALQRIALADLPPDKRPRRSTWSPSFWKWAPKVARKALGMKAYTPRWGWNDLV